MPLRLRIIIVSAVATGLITVATALALTHNEGVGPLGEFIAFTAMIGVNWAFPLLVPRQQDLEAFFLDEAFLVAMVLLLPPLAVVLAFAIGVPLGLLVRGRPPVRVAFNAGAMATAIGLAVATARLSGTNGGVEPADLLAVILGAGVFLIVNAAFVSAVLAVTENVDPCTKADDARWALPGHLNRPLRSPNTVEVSRHVERG